MEQTRKKRRTKEGMVIKNKAEKTVIVVVYNQIRHSVYKKYIKKKTTYAAHDEANQCNVGDLVLLTESRPLSRTKRWRVSKVLKKVQ